MMTFTTFKKPSEWFNSVKDGNIRLQDCPKSVRSWFGFILYRQAVHCLSLKEKQERINFIEKCPESCREELKTEVLRLWNQRRKQ